MVAVNYADLQKLSNSQLTEASISVVIYLRTSDNISMFDVYDLMGAVYDLDASSLPTSVLFGFIIENRMSYSFSQRDGLSDVVVLRNARMTSVAPPNVPIDLTLTFPQHANFDKLADILIAKKAQMDILVYDDTAPVYSNGADLVYSNRVLLGQVLDATIVTNSGGKNATTDGFSVVFRGSGVLPKNGVDNNSRQYLTDSISF